MRLTKCIGNSTHLEFDADLLTEERLLLKSVRKELMALLFSRRGYFYPQLHTLVYYLVL
jgi:hypothetical protein